jgi:phosphoribosylamine--glycine ligase
VKVLIVGSGGREHAIAEALSRSPRVSKLFTAPGNAGTGALGENVAIGADALDALVDFADRGGIELTVVGPEVPLSLGIVDRFRARGLPIVGPTSSNARLEASKSFTKRLCTDNAVPTAAYVECDSARRAYEVIEGSSFPLVIKADGLAAGKGVIVADTAEVARRAVRDMMEESTLGRAGSRVVIEDFMAGEEASYHVFVDGQDLQGMVVSQDHKRRYAMDQGPNTGGMGAYSQDAVMTEDDRRFVLDRMIRPTLAAMGDYTGILYAGLMRTSEGPKLVEYNVRFGDPETQVILPRLQTDLADVFLAMRDHRLGELDLRWNPVVAATVVLVMDTYPGKVEKGKEVRGLGEAGQMPDVTVYHAGTRMEDGRVVTSGGRVLNVTAVGATLPEALQKAYAAAEVIDFEGKDYRRDIGQKGLAKGQ